MIDPKRLRGMLQLRGMSQSALARRIGVAQSTINKLALGGNYGSKHIHRIARELLTTPAYLTGEIDDPDVGAPSPPQTPEVVHVMLPVALPSTNALARMFEGLLEVVDRTAPLDELARELAELLPTGLSALKGPLIEGEAARRLERAADAVRATSVHEPAR